MSANHTQGSSKQTPDNICSLQSEPRPLYNVAGEVRFLREVKKIIRGMSLMSKPAYIILCGSLMISCVIVFAAFVLLISIGDVKLETYQLFLCVKELTQIPASLLLLSSIAAVLVEEQVKK